MSADPLTQISTRVTPQDQPATPDQVPNSAGGYTFTIDPMSQLRRFLILGSAGGTYYVGEQAATAEAGALVIELARTRGMDVLEAVLEISTRGLAPKQQPAILALAAVAGVGNDEARKRALEMVPLVCRTGTTLFTFVKYVEQFRGWGRGLKRAVAGWYTSREPADLAYQILKYQNREGFTHRDVLRLAHPVDTNPSRQALYDYACGREVDPELRPVLPAIVTVRDAVHRGELSAAQGATRGLSWEMLPSESLNDAGTWEALLDRGLPLGALLRQLPRLTRLGLCAPMSSSLPVIRRQLTDPERLAKARIHPMAVLIALKTYQSGVSLRGDSTWSPAAPVVDALDEAFYTSFGNVVPSGKRTLLALDVSGSMGSAVTGLPLSCREAVAALAMVTARVETSHQFIAFTGVGGSMWRRDYSGQPLGAVSELDISPRQRLDDVLRTISGLPFGATDCALPMIWAQAKGVPIDVFHVLTDNETWAGDIQPHQALAEYRRKTGIDAKLIVHAMTATRFSIADPDDPGMLDICGLDASTPALTAAFARGEI